MIGERFVCRRLLSGLGRRETRTVTTERASRPHDLPRGGQCHPHSASLTFTFPSTAPPTPLAASRATPGSPIRIRLRSWASALSRSERCAPTALVVARELQVVVLARAMPTAIRPMPDQESSHVRSAQSARSYDGRGSPAKPSAALRSWPRWSSTPRSLHPRPGRAPGRSGRLGLAYAASACEPAVRSTAGLGIALYRRERS